MQVANIRHKYKSYMIINFPSRCLETQNANDCQHGALLTPGLQTLPMYPTDFTWLFNLLVYLGLR